jgi:hypothetical protein
MRLFREKPLPTPTLHRFEDIEPAIPGQPMYPDPPAWVPPVFKTVVFILAVIFFPITLWVLWGMRYRGWFMGGHAGWEEDYEETDWAAVHRGDIPPPKLLRYDSEGHLISTEENPDG